MDDRLLVSRAAAGDLDSFGQLYDAYFGRVYDFAWRVTLDADIAARATEDVLVGAAAELRERGRDANFRSWLFARAHRVVLERVPASIPGVQHEEAFGSFESPDPCRVDDAAVPVEDAEIACIVWEAVAALSPADRAMLDLHLRQGMDSSAIAGVLGLSKNAAVTVVQRMKDAASAVVSGYVVARTSECRTMERIASSTDLSPYTNEARSTVDAHISTCAICQGVQRSMGDPLELYSALMPVQAPYALKADIWQRVAEGWGRPLENRVGALGAVPSFADAASDAAPFGTGTALPGAAAADGLALGMGGAGYGGSGSGAFGGATGGDWDRKRILWFVGAVAAFVAFAFVVGAIAVSAIGGGGGSSGGAAGSASRTPSAPKTPTPGISITPGVAIQTATPNLTPSATPTEVDTPTPEASATPTPRPVTPTPSIRTVAPPKSPSPISTTAGTQKPKPTKTP